MAAAERQSPAHRQRASSASQCRPPPPPATPAATETPAPPPADQAPPASEPRRRRRLKIRAQLRRLPKRRRSPGSRAGSCRAAGPEGADPPRAGIVAFHAGKDDEAFQLLATHYLITLDATDDLLAKMQWVPGLRRPALATRFGLAVAYTAPAEFKDNPQPIGSKEAATAFAQNLRQPGSGDPNAAAAPAGEQGGTVPESTNPAMNSLTWYTGEVGSKVVAALKGQVEAGTFGETLKEASTFAPPVDPNQPQPAPPPKSPTTKIIRTPASCRPA